MSHIIEIIVIISSYFIGCISTGYYLVRLRLGQDVRSLGSGSTGTRNVGRILGKQGFVITLLGDLIKGMIPVGIAIALQLDTWCIMLAIIAVIVGHIWPIQLRFRGGRGAATTIGALLVFDYRIVLITILIGCFIYFFRREQTVSGLIALIFSPVIAFVLGQPVEVILYLIALVVIILIAHRSVIREYYKVIRNRT